MITKVLPLLMLSLPVLAQDDPWQVGIAMNLQGSHTVIYQGSSSTIASFERERKWVPSLQAGYRLWDFGSSDLSVTGEYQFPTNFKTDIYVRGLATPNSSSDARIQHFAPGVQWNLHKAVDFGFGLQYRLMRIETELVEDDKTTVNLNRPWLSGYVGHTFRNVQPVKPFLALRASWMVGSISAPSSFGDVLANESDRKQLVRALAPSREISLQAGVRF
jgi:hypothetical protein